MNLSTGMQACLAAHGYHQALSNGWAEARSGSMPATADAADTGTLLAVVTLNGGAYTGETRARWKITLAGSSGSVDTIKIGGMPVLPAAVNFTSTLAATATAVAAAINANSTNPKFDASTDDDDVYITAPYGSGTDYNAVVCATTATTMTATVAGDGTPNGSGGTAGVAAVNGLNWQYPPVAGVLSKESTTWQDSSANASGTVGYIRLKLDATDDGTLSTTYRRIDFSVASSGADINGTSLVTTAAAPFIISDLPLTIPKAGSAT